MQSLEPDQKTKLRCDRLHRIETGYDISATSVDRKNDDMPFLLRRAKEVRERDPFEHQQIVGEILARESTAIKGMVQAAGVAKTGRRWVDESDVEDVASAALARLADFLGSMSGTTPGELRAAARRCVHYAAVDHVRADQRDHSVPVDHGHFTDALSPEETQYAELAGLTSANRAEDRAIFKEKVELITMLEPRAADVVKLRGIEGMPSKEVAEQLGLTVANVDQIFKRSLAKIARLAT